MPPLVSIKNLNTMDGVILSVLVHVCCCRGEMEEWDFVDERELQGWKGGVLCMTCQHFCYGLDRHCHSLLGCNARKKQLQQGDLLKKKCQLWAPTWEKEFGWAAEAG